MADLKKIQQWQELLEEAKEKKAKAEGAYEQLMATLKKEFGCKSVKEAEKKLTEMRKEAEEQEERLDELVEDFEKEYADVLTT